MNINEHGKLRAEPKIEVVKSILIKKIIVFNQNFNNKLFFLLNFYLLAILTILTN